MRHNVMALLVVLVVAAVAVRALRSRTPDSSEAPAPLSEYMVDKIRLGDPPSRVESLYGYAREANHQGDPPPGCTVKVYRGGRHKITYDEQDRAVEIEGLALSSASGKTLGRASDYEDMEAMLGPPASQKSDHYRDITYFYPDKGLTIQISHWETGPGVSKVILKAPGGSQP